MDGRKENQQELDGRSMGPIGLLIKELNKINVEINEALEITETNEAPISIWHTPW